MNAKKITRTPAAAAFLAGYTSATQEEAPENTATAVSSASETSAETTEQTPLRRDKTAASSKSSSLHASDQKVYIKQSVRIPNYVRAAMLRFRADNPNICIGEIYEEALCAYLGPYIDKDAKAEFDRALGR